MYKAVLFDLDGVLVDMLRGHFEALNRALSLFGTAIENNEHHRSFNGLPTEKKLEMLSSQGRIPRGLHEFVNILKQKHTKEVIPVYCTPAYSKILLLRELKTRGYLLGCCSNSMKETLHLMLKSAHLFDYLNLVLGNDEITKPKPDPEIYLTAFTRLGIAPDETIIVEDSPVGIAAAIASGAQVRQVRNTDDVHLDLFADILYDRQGV